MNNKCALKWLKKHQWIMDGRRRKIGKKCIEWTWIEFEWQATIAQFLLMEWAGMEEIKFNWNFTLKKDSIVWAVSSSFVKIWF